MGDDNKKQLAIEKLDNLVTLVEEEFVTDDLVGWQQLFVLYYCITSMGEDIPLELLQRIQDCGLAAYIYLMGQESELNNCNKQSVSDAPLATMQEFFKTGSAREKKAVYLNALQSLASPEYIKTLVFKD